MATEIELKAWVQNSEGLKAVLTRTAEYLGAFEKEDAYWFPVPGIPSGLRVRKEKNTAPDGKITEIISGTYKLKEVREGIEINDEREFGLSQAVEFEELLTRLGLHKGSSKRKKGWAYTYRGITAELTEVERLGWFVELEILADGRGEEIIANGRRRLLEFLKILNVSEEAIEPRYYTEMLHALKPL
jgi:adenylate cyclase class 2